jgi:hypothetical protein
VIIEQDVQFHTHHSQRKREPSWSEASFRIAPRANLRQNSTKIFRRGIKCDVRGISNELIAEKQRMKPWREQRHCPEKRKIPKMRLNKMNYTKKNKFV